MSISQDALKENNKVWECLGPISNGGTVFGLAISPVADVQRYWAATGCGIFYSDDKGASWQQNLTGLTTPLLSALSVAPNGALFAGGLAGDLFSSFDFGATWEPGFVADEYRATVTVLQASPNFQHDGIVFAATDGAGLLVARGSGAQWEDSSFGLGAETVLALACPKDWDAGELMFAATLDGVFVSRNGGRAWRETELMLDDDVVDVLAVSPSFGEDRTVLAGTEAGALYVSTDGGRRWNLLIDTIGDGPVNCLWVAPDYAESHYLVAGVGRSIYTSADGGKSWTLAAELPGSLLALTGQGTTLLAGLHDAGIYQSVDAGKTWASASEGLAARGFSRLVDGGDKVYAVGPQEGIWSSQDMAAWTSLDVAPDLYPVAAMSAGGKALAFASQTAGIMRSEDGGATWQTACDVQEIQALALVPGQSQGWAGTAQGALYTTQDGGATWRQSDSPAEGQEILSIVASPTFDQDHTLYMGTAMAPTGNKQARVALWRSSNGGESWRQLTTQVTTARWLDIAMPSGVAEDAALQAVVATGPYCLRPLRRAKDVWISTQVDAQGSNALSVVALGAVDQGGMLFTATGSGVFRSIDGGRTWQPFSAGLTSYSFISLVVRQEQGVDVLYALSLGGLIWRREL